MRWLLTGAAVLIVVLGALATVWLETREAERTAERLRRRYRE